MGKNLKGKEIGKGLSQRADGRYEARAKINGKIVRIYDMSLSKLKKRFEEEKAKVLRDEKGVRPNLTLKGWYDEWFEKCKGPSLKSDISRSTYSRKIRNTYIRVLGDKKLEDLSFMDIQTATYQLMNEEQYSKRTIKEAIGVLQECLDIAVANRLIPSNVCGNILLPAEEGQKKERRVMEHWEQEAFLKEVEGTYYDEVYRILLCTGMRIGELSGLQWDDVDFTQKCIHIRRSMMTGYLEGKRILELVPPKTANSYRDIPFFLETESLFLSWKKKQDVYKKKLGKRWRAGDEFGDLVFTTTVGSPVTRYNIVHDMKRVESNINAKEQEIARKTGKPPRHFKHMHPHAFRHTFCTRLFESNTNPVVVQAIMGHANYSTTLSYTHVLEEKTKEEVERIGNILNISKEQTGSITHHLMND